MVKGKSHLTTPLKLVGWKERILISGFRRFTVVAKVDSGASISSLHVRRYSFLEGVDAKGRTTLRFEVVAKEGQDQEHLWFEAPFVRFASVKPSTAEPQQRAVVLLKIGVGGDVFETECSLVCRSGMKCRMLLGRSATSGRYLIDTSRVFLRPQVKRKADTSC